MAAWRTGALWLGLAVAVSSCCGGFRQEIPTGCPMPVDNTFAKPDYQHATVHNVLLLPLDNPMDVPDFELHYEELVNSILRNFGKFHYFNLQYDHHFHDIAGEIMNLDTDFVDRVKVGEIGKEYNAQAIMEVSIRELRTYPPMRARIKAALIDTSTGDRIWAFDHTFDTDDADVINAMRLWWNSRVAGGDSRNHFRLATIRPTVFSNFVFYTMARSYAQARVQNVISIHEQMMREQAAQAEMDSLQPEYCEYEEEYSEEPTSY